MKPSQTNLTVDHTQRRSKRKEGNLLQKGFKLEVFGSRNLSTYGDSGWSPGASLRTYWDSGWNPGASLAYGDSSWSSGSSLASARLNRKEPGHRLDERSRPGAVKVPLYLAGEVFSGGSAADTKPIVHKAQISKNGRALTSSRSMALPSKMAYLEPIVEEDPILLRHLMHSPQEFIDSSRLVSSAVTVSNWKERVKKLSRGISANAAVRYLSQMSNRRRIVKVEQTPSK